MEAASPDERPPDPPLSRMLPQTALFAVALLALSMTTCGRAERATFAHCAPERSSHQIQVMHVWPEDHEAGSRDAAREAIEAAVAQADDYLSASGPGHRIRWACDDGQLDIAFLRAPPVGDDGIFAYAEAVATAREAGHGRRDRLYAIFYPDGAGYEGVGESSGPGDASQGPQFAFIVEWSGYWTLHEVGHTLGAVPSKAPHQFASGHCSELNDVMCRRPEHLDQPDYEPELNCPSKPIWQFDCNHDDYYMHDGDWWDVADSPYLYLDGT